MRDLIDILRDIRDNKLDDVFHSHELCRELQIILSQSHRQNRNVKDRG